MKPTIRILAAAALVLVIALGAWQGVTAQRGLASGVPRAGLRDFLAPLIPAAARVSKFQPGDDSATQQPEAIETPKAMDDHATAGSDDNTSEPTESSEASDDHGQEAHTAEPELHGEVTGVVTAIDGNSVTINGQVYSLSNSAEGASNVQIGDTVTIEFVTNADGSVTVREVKAGDTSSSNSDDSNHSKDDSSAHHKGGSGSGSDGGDDGGGSGGGHGGGGGG